MWKADRTARRQAGLCRVSNGKAKFQNGPCPGRLSGDFGHGLASLSQVAFWPVPKRSRLQTMVQRLWWARSASLPWPTEVRLCEYLSSRWALLLHSLFPLEAPSAFLSLSASLTPSRTLPFPTGQPTSRTSPCPILSCVYAATLAAAGMTCHCYH